MRLVLLLVLPVVEDAAAFAIYERAMKTYVRAMKTYVGAMKAPTSRGILVDSQRLCTVLPFAQRGIGTSHLSNQSY